MIENVINELDFKNKALIHELKVQEEINLKLKEMYKKAIESLKFYADSDSWGHESSISATYSVIGKEDLGNGDFQLSDIVDDERVGGRLARETLKELGEL